MNSSRNKTKKQLDSQLSSMKKNMNMHYANSSSPINGTSHQNSYSRPVNQNYGYNDYNGNDNKNEAVVKQSQQKEYKLDIKQIKQIKQNLQNQKQLNNVLQKKIIILEKQLEKTNIKSTGDIDLLQNKFYYTQKQLLRIQNESKQLIQKLNQEIVSYLQKNKSLEKDLEQKNKTIQELQSQLELLKKQKKQLLVKISQQIQQRLKAEESQKIAKHDIKVSVKYTESLQTALLKKQPMNSKEQRQFRVLRNLYVQKQKTQKQKHYYQRKPYFQMIEDLEQLKTKLKLPQQPEQDQKHLQLRKIIQNHKKQINDLKQQNSLLNQRIQNYFTIKQINSVQQDLIVKLEGQNSKYRQQIQSLRSKVMQNQEDEKYMKSTGNFFTNQTNSSKQHFKEYYKIKFDIYQKRKNRYNGSHQNIGKIYSP